MATFIDLVTTTVTLPKWIFEQAKSKDELKGLTLSYLERYPHLKLVQINVKEQIAICIRK